ncbi:MFS transporter [Sphingomonas sp. NFX23]|uniref:MFS transporter n=1 Tax=Sphingomonas sp. NFX23 TaxID=2819532 RepID=UPI003CF5BBC0
MTGRSSVLLPSPHLSWGGRVGYGIGDFAFNLFFTTASLFLLFYYTDVLGLTPAVAGWVFAGALIWDAIFDPWIGYIASRTRTRWGRYRPYVLLGALPLAASWALMFLPTTLGGSALVLFAAATHILFRTMFAVVGMPFLAMSAVLTRDSAERGVLAGIRMVAGAAAGLFGAVATLKLVTAFGGGQTGFFWTAVLYGALATAILIFVFTATREAPVLEDEPRPAVGEMIRMLSSNRAFWLVSAAMLLGAVGQTFFQKTLPYFFKYQLGREDLISPALGILAASVMVSIPAWTWLSKRTSKRTMWLTGSVVGVVGSVLLWVIPETPSNVLPVLILVGAGAGASYLGFWSMIPDTVEFGEWRSGVRAEGAVFGLVSLIQKASLGLAAAGLGEALSAIGYTANVAQTPATLASMRFLMIVLPAILLVAAAAVIAFYPLDQQTHRRIVRVLGRRRARLPQ